jgi:sterol desaturase/sphingolipid hydroxylase (fatty acid hydroxylase superfamily)
VYAGNLAVLVLWSPWLFLLYDAVHEHALLDLGRGSALAQASPLALGALTFLAEDLCFYVFHRSSHRVRLLWAAHEPHHSSAGFNWTVAVRQTWTPFLAAAFWLPLMLLGFDPFLVLAAQGASLVFQSFLHTELAGTLGPLGWVLNTPGHHRVHHGYDAHCVDRNFGGVLIVWDRLLGTFEARPPTRYGVDELPPRYNPLAISFRAWGALLRDCVRARSLRVALGHLLRPPGWAPPTSKGSRP